MIGTMLSQLEAKAIPGTEGGISPFLSPDSRWLGFWAGEVMVEGILVAVPFDLEKLQLSGQSVPIISNVIQAINIPHGGWHTAAGQFSVANSGWLVYAPIGIVPDWENSLVRVDQKGIAQPAASLRVPFYSPRLSPDGQRAHAHSAVARPQ